MCAGAVGGRQACVAASDAAHAAHARTMAVCVGAAAVRLNAACAHRQCLPSGGQMAVWSDGGVRPEMGLVSGGCRGAEPPAIGPRSGKFLRFETLEGHFLAKIKVHAP